MRVSEAAALDVADVQRQVRRQRHRDGAQLENGPGRARARALPRRAYHATLGSVAQRRRHHHRRAVVPPGAQGWRHRHRAPSAPGQSVRSSPSAQRPRAWPGACRGTRSGSAPLSRSQQPAPGLWNCRKRAIGRCRPCRRTTHATSSPHAAPSPNSATRRAGKGANAPFADAAASRCCRAALRSAASRSARRARCAVSLRVLAAARKYDVTSWDLKVADYAAKRYRIQGSTHGGHGMESAGAGPHRRRLRRDHRTGQHPAAHRARVGK